MTGETATRDREFGFRFPDAMAAGTGEVAVLDREGTLGGYAPGTGERRWSVADIQFRGAPRYVGSLVVGRDGGSVFGVDPAAESVAFRVEAADEPGPLARAGSRVVFRDGEQGGAVRGVDPSQFPREHAILGISGFVHVVDAANGDHLVDRAQPVADGESAAFVTFAGTEDLALAASRNEMLGLSL